MRFSGGEETGRRGVVLAEDVIDLSRIPSSSTTRTFYLIYFWGFLKFCSEIQKVLKLQEQGS